MSCPGTGVVLSTVGLAQTLAPDPQPLWIAVSEDAKRWPDVAGGRLHIVCVKAE